MKDNKLKKVNGKLKQPETLLSLLSRPKVRNPIHKKSL